MRTKLIVPMGGTCAVETAVWRRIRGEHRGSAAAADAVERPSDDAPSESMEEDTSCPPAERGIERDHAVAER